MVWVGMEKCTPPVATSLVLSSDPSQTHSRPQNHFTSVTRRKLGSVLDD
jgi:hypothetical protein